MAVVHRISQLRVTCCYRTVLYAAAVVISGIAPIKMMAKEKMALYNSMDKESARSNLYEKLI